MLSKASPLNQSFPLVVAPDDYSRLDNQTPADKAGIKIEGENKWITLIQNAKVRKP